MSTRTAAVVIALAAWSTAAACGSDTAPVPATPETTSSTTTSTTADTTEPAADTTTTPAASPVGTESPLGSAQRLFDAWFADDRVTAATVAEPDAVTGMWETTRGDYALYNQCDSAEFDTSGCLFRGANGTIQFTMERRDDRWIVIGAFFSAP